MCHHSRKKIIVISWQQKTAVIIGICICFSALEATIQDYSRMKLFRYRRLFSIVNYEIILHYWWRDYTPPKMPQYKTILVQDYFCHRRLFSRSGYYSPSTSSLSTHQSSIYGLGLVLRLALLVLLQMMLLTKTVNYKPVSVGSYIGGNL